MQTSHTLYCSDHDDGSRALYTLRCRVTGESQSVVVCQEHGEKMPLIDGEMVTAVPCDSGITCDFHGGSR